MASKKGTKGNDVLTGTASNDTFNLVQGGNDTASGLAGNDLFKFGATFTAKDKVSGGVGQDTLSLAGDYSKGVTFAATTMVGVETITLGAHHDYKLTMNDATVAKNQTLTVNASKLSAADILTFNGTRETNGKFDLVGGKGNDVLTGGFKADIFALSHGGNDTAKGGGGNDAFNLGSAFTAADKLDGGNGTDTLSLNGNYGGARAIAFGAKTILGVENIVLASGHDYALTTVNTTVAAGAILTVNATALAAANTLLFNGAAETDGIFHIIGGAGNDVLTGGSLADTFDLSHGGNDTVSGGAGNDLFKFGATFNAQDHVDGGDGNDTLSLSGNYSGANALVLNGDTHLSSIETLQLSAGNNYNISIADGALDSDAMLKVSAAALGAANALTLELSATTAGSFNIIGGAGNDHVTIGADLAQSGVTFNGGNGDDTLVLDPTQGSDTITVNFSHISNVEHLTLLAASSLAIDITVPDSALAVGQTLSVDASALSATAFLNFDGSAETGGIFNIIGGDGNDTLTGGGQFDTFDLSHGGNDTVSGGGANDIFNFGTTFNAQDHVDGGAGNDTLVLTGDYGTLTFDGSNTVSVESVELGAGHSYNVVMEDGFTPANQTALIDGTLLLSTDTITFDGTGETDGATHAIGGAGADVLVGGPHSDILEGAAGNDHIDFSHDTFGSFVATGGTGADTIDVGGALVSTDRIDGGTGNDTVIMTGDNFVDTLTFNSQTMQNVDKLEFTGSSAPAIVTNDATVATGATMTIDAHALTGGLTFDGHLETDGHFTILGGDGNDTLTGGLLADTLTGNGGADAFKYTDASQSESTTYDHITDFDATHDFFDVASAVTAVGAASGAMNTATFDTDLAARIGTFAHAHDAFEVTATSGTLSGHIFLVVDTDGNASYTAGGDLVVDITGFTGTITAANFT